jgi:hypothetical protein
MKPVIFDRGSPVKVNILVESYRAFVPGESSFEDIRSIENGANRHSDERKRSLLYLVFMTAIYIACPFAMSTA